MTDQTRALEADSSAPRSSTPPAARVMRADIQGIRALAVGAVVIYHFWPDALPGGFIGVDVFFAVSGFLITSHILSDVQRRSTGSFLLNFWARRIRRLMPAGLTVLAFVLVATALFLPKTEWPLIGKHVVFTSAFGENWLLAHEAVDYLASENAPSPVQHYWSLSVEEQFYVFWPLLMVAALWLGRRAGRARTVAAAAVALVTVVSFAYSLWATKHDPDAAYFITPTRVWQLSAGSLMAFVVLRSTAARFALPWIGFATVVVGCFLVDGSLPYPGYAALVPTVGTCLMLVGLQDRRFSFDWLSSPRPVQWLGDVSYSLYLWHWPLIVLAPEVLDIDLRGVEKVLLLAATLLISHLSFRYIETPARRSQTFARRPGLTYATGLVAVLAIVASATYMHGNASATIREAQSSLDARSADAADCFGATALRPGCKDPFRDVDPVNLAAAEDDKPAPWSKKCANGLGKANTKTCELGDPRGSETVLVWGDSHAGAWSSAFDNAGKRGKFRVVMAMRHGCPSSMDSPAATVGRTITGDEREQCRLRNLWVAKRLVPRADAVIITNMMSNYRYDGDDQVAGYAKSVEAVRDADKPVFFLQDAALTGDDQGNRHNGPKCLAREGQCTNPVARALEDRGATEQLAAETKIKVIPTRDQFCDAKQCYAAIGGVSVYFDSSHLTAAYGASMGPWLAKTLADEGVV
ncbi:hypothetical protein ASD11_11960 [Aeromicrobium sp. Root495]|uniref:acyltransferase family protein n=1 Tax=Aeromicrobium sp. Root495 TaxID=1736550 RepID=UPI0006F7F4B7|nr:acyltransferase family protein [Aeromicrobium sp. Root495]KQY60182.1 hypothetical protein ASD11_11960 [Aeromicrobium sp. Root495]